MELLSEADLTRRATFPENVDIRGIAEHLAARVFEQAVEENLKISNKVTTDCTYCVHDVDVARCDNCR